MVGWTRFPNEHKIDNGISTAYQLPKELLSSKVYLYAINSEGETFSEYCKRRFKTPGSAAAVYVANKALEYVEKIDNWTSVSPEDRDEGKQAAENIYEAFDGGLSDSKKNTEGIIGGLEIFSSLPDAPQSVITIPPNPNCPRRIVVSRSYWDAVHAPLTDP